MNRPDGIHPAEPHDVPFIWNLIRELADFERLAHAVTGSEEGLRKSLFEEEGLYASVAVCAGSVIGYTIAFRTYSTFATAPGIWLEDIYVTPSHRGQGWGKRLLTHLAKQTALRGWSRLDWAVLEWNQGAIEFYEGLGAKRLLDWQICRLEGAALDQFR